MSEEPDEPLAAGDLEPDAGEADAAEPEAAGADQQAERPPDDTIDDTSDDTIADAQAAIDAARRRVLEAPAEVVVTNHVMGLYELAAIHLSADQPDLRAAALAIDAVGCLVEGLGERLGGDAKTLRDALANIRMAFVEIKGRTAGATS